MGVLVHFSDVVHEDLVLLNNLTVLRIRAPFLEVLDISGCYGLTQLELLEDRRYWGQKADSNTNLKISEDETGLSFIYVRGFPDEFDKDRFSPDMIFNIMDIESCSH